MLVPRKISQSQDLKPKALAPLERFGCLAVSLSEPKRPMFGGLMKDYAFSLLLCALRFAHASNP